jgi:hypothetical protein
MSEYLSERSQVPILGTPSLSLSLSLSLRDSQTCPGQATLQPQLLQRPCRSPASSRGVRVATYMNKNHDRKRTSQRVYPITFPNASSSLVSPLKRTRFLFFRAIPGPALLCQ